MNKLSVSETIVMQAIWKEWDGVNPVTTSQFKHHFVDRGWTIPTTFTFIRRLEEKGFIRAERSNKSRRENVYYPLITLEEWKNDESHLLISRLYGGYKGFFASLIGNPNITDDVINELQKTLDKKKNNTTS